MRRIRSWRLGCVFVVPMCVSITLTSANETPNHGTANRALPTQRDEVAAGYRWGYSVFLLLNDKKVQGQLTLTDEQRSAIDRLAGEYLNTLGRVVEDARTRAVGDDKLSAERMRILVTKRAELLRTYAKSGSELLSEGQRKRLDQVAFQLCGIDALKYTEVIEELRLTEAQKNKVAAINAWRVAEWRKLLERPRTQNPDGKERQKHLDELLAEAKKRLLACLSSEQRNWFESMEGPDIGFRRHDLDLQIRKKKTQQAKEVTTK